MGSARSSDVVRLVRVVTAGLVAAATLMSDISAVAPKNVSCSGEISGTVGGLVVPAGATCSASDLTATGNITVKPGATLIARGALTAGGSISIATSATLDVASTSIEISGDIVAAGALTIAVVKIPLQGAVGTIGGDLSITGATTVAVLGLVIDGNVVVQQSGAEGIEIGANEIHETLTVQNNAVLGRFGPSLFSIHSNRVNRKVQVLANDASGAFEPPFVGGNTVSRGNLVCYENVPDLTNDHLGDVSPNTVLNGRKLGQCAEL